MKHIFLSTILLFSLFIACTPKVQHELGERADKGSSPMGSPRVEQSEQDGNQDNREAQAAYTQSIHDARAERLAILKKPQGWLSLVGLHWLKEGMNSIGAAEDNTIIFPRITTETIGAYQKEGHEIFFGKVEGVEVNHGENEYLGGPVSVGYPPEIVNHESLYWYIMKRGERYAIRLKDTLAEKRMKFGSIPYFPIDNKYKIKAEVQLGNAQDSVTITNVLDQQKTYPVAAYLNFYLAEHYYSLAALDEGEDNYFLVFGDMTNSESTYGGGRFLYPKKPCDSCELYTMLDFNLAQNPPCAVTDFATCPVPPMQNRLKFKVEAGEKNLGEH